MFVIFEILQFEILEIKDFEMNLKFEIFELRFCKLKLEIKNLNFVIYLNLKFEIMTLEF